MKYIGAHVSAAGGVANAPTNAAAIGATAFALFTKNQRQCHAAPLAEAEIAALSRTAVLTISIMDRYFLTIATSRTWATLSPKNVCSLSTLLLMR